MRVQSVVPRIAVIGVLTSWSPGAAVGQQLTLAPQTPRFFYASSTAAKPVEIDVSHNAVLGRVVSLHVEHNTIGGVLADIQRQTGLTFAYHPHFPATRPVTLVAESITVAAALGAILVGTGVDVVLTPTGHVWLTEAKRPAPRVQGGAIVGSVTDKQRSDPIIGATVVLDPTRQHAITGTDGRYRFADLPPGSYTVRARYIGYVALAASVSLGADQEAQVDFPLMKSAQQLQEVVTTGTVVPTEVKALPTPVSVVTADDIQQANVTRLDQLFRGFIPGSIAWDQGVNDYYSTIAVRGATSIYDSPTIKTYIDGIEVADPLYIATIDPNMVDRVEVTRGPQASTIYGSDASGGVLQIFTKKGSINTRPQLAGKVAAGAMQSPFSNGVPLQQDYALSVSGGGTSSTYNIGGSYQRLGEWTPGYYSRNPGFFAGGQWSQNQLTLGVSARYTSKAFASTYSPALGNLWYFSQPAYLDEEVRQQTYGVQIAYRATAHWQHRLSLGYDRHALDYQNSRPRFTTPADSFLQVFTSGESKASLGYNTSFDVTVAPAVVATLTGGIDHYFASLQSDFTGNATRNTGTIDGDHFVSTTPFENTGYFGQLQLGVRDAFFVTGGLRGEQNDNFGDGYGTAWSPRLGASYTREVNGVSVKLRGSYGSAIRPPKPYQKQASLNPFLEILANPNLGPERQTGWDAGLELYVGTAVSFGVTYYDQKAKDLVDQVLLNTSGPIPQAQFQNVGEIRNQGWEFESALTFGRLGFRATYSRPTSTVRELSPSYSGDLRVGDRLLEIPSSVARASVNYTFFQHTNLGVEAVHIGNWTAIDWLSYYAFILGAEPFRGSGRDYWLEYPTITKINVALSQRVTDQLTGFVHVANVGNNTRFEQRNSNIPLGRVTTVGLRFQY